MLGHPFGISNILSKLHGDIPRVQGDPLSSILPLRFYPTRSFTFSRDSPLCPAMAAESPRKSAYAVHHHLDPFARQTIAIAIVERGYYSLFECLIEILCISHIGQAIIGVACSFTDRESVRSVVGFCPPTIENTAIESTVENRFLAARSRRLQWTTRVV